ncbi:MAG: hypothetical protein A3F83_04385 [Candidatus Glassbacteria bacterium RIFCSPLOWO2_12_FULL_58_11]|uniref:FlgD Ig-like domain-containing protein n=1 Tax=Candidatus Glassbacteria bacterium RIFCSPLOWO2_12_FULL_58_11 TaxID=1817867 RepID=A0A1F5YSE3_9BACT|nr:MAG: hypothetical protein A3F83_04385 [Candidatus Glassbacteria bacterium RIFCSPLOWO2_12_FULL_58_11]
MSLIVRLLVPLLFGCSLARAENLFTNYDRSNAGLITELVKCVVIDAEGAKWFGGKDQGAMKFDTTWTFFYQFKGDINSDAVKHITVDSNGDVWFAGNQGVSRLSGTLWTNYTFATGLASDNTYHVAQDKDGIYWVATDNGVNRYDGRIWTTFTQFNGLGENWVNYILADRDSVLWFGLKTKGISRYDGTTWQTISWIKGVDKIEVRVICQDLEGNIWVGTRLQGVSKFDGQNWTTYTTADGLVSNNVWGIAIDSAGNKWFATFGGGVSMFDGRRWISYTEKDDGLALNVVNDVAVDRDGTLWFATDNGISTLKPENIKQPPIPTCDINGDRRLNISDAISLILLLRDRPDVVLADYDGDGKGSLADVIWLLKDLRYGNCPPLSASPAGAVPPVRKLNTEDVAYVTGLLHRLELASGEIAEFAAALHALGETPSLPAAFSLEGNVPNPFNPSTTIRYSVPEGKPVRTSLKVFDLRGAQVRTLVETVREPGQYTIFWDGLDDFSRPVPSGVYFYRLQAPEFSATRKMVLLK